MVFAFVLDGSNHIRTVGSPLKNSKDWHGTLSSERSLSLLFSRKQSAPVFTLWALRARDFMVSCKRVIFFVALTMISTGKHTSSGFSETSSLRFCRRRYIVS